jgi:hypothetical protein
MKDRVIQVLKKNSGLKAREIAYHLSTERREVNRILYNDNFGTFRRDEYYRWYLLSDRINKTTSFDPEVSDAIKAINTVHEIIDNITNNDSSVFYPKTDSVAEFNNYSELLRNVDYHLLSFCIDIYNLDVGNYYDSVERFFENVYEKIDSAFDTSINANNFRDFSGFCTRYNKVPLFLKGVAEYDTKNQTVYGELVLKCFEILGGCIDEVFIFYDFDLDDDEKYPSHIDSMRSYMQNFTNVSSITDDDDFDDSLDEEENEEESIEESSCFMCGESFDLDDLTEGQDGELYCSDCFEEDSGEIESPLKLEIIESCMTCKYKKISACAKSIYNKPCSNYLYMK